MTGGVQVERRSGQLVAVKAATGPDGIERLHREARMLAVVRLPGVVEFVELTESEGGARLATAYVGPHTAATARPRSLAQAVALVTAVAGTVADLHDLGIVHGRLDPTHILIDDDGRPVLCGFRGAGLVGDPSPPDTGGRSDTGGPSEPVRPTTLRPSLDVMGLGRLLDQLANSGVNGCLLPAGTKRHRRGGASAGANVDQLLASLVRSATAEDPACRPSARSFALAVQALSPSAVLARPRPRPAPQPGEPHVDDTAGPGPAPGTPPPPPVTQPGLDRLRPIPPRPSRPGPKHHQRRTDPPSPGSARRGRRPLTAAAIVAAAVATGLGVASSWVGLRPSLADGGSPVPLAGAVGLAAPAAGAVEDANLTIPRATDPPTTPTTDLGVGLGSTPPPVDPPVCPSTRTPEAPAVPAPPCTTSVPTPATGVVIAGGRFAIGEPGDEILVGDWRCRGALAVAVVRPAWGDVYLFEQLPDEAHEAHAVPVAHLARGARLETGPAEPDGCPALIGRFPDGSTAVVTIPDALPATPPEPQENP